MVVASRRSRKITLPEKWLFASVGVRGLFKVRNALHCIRAAWRAFQACKHLWILYDAALENKTQFMMLFVNIQNVSSSDGDGDHSGGRNRLEIRKTLDPNIPKVNML